MVLKPKKQGIIILQGDDGFEIKNNLSDGSLVKGTFTQKLNVMFVCDFRMLQFFEAHIIKLTAYLSLERGELKEGLR